MPSLQAAPSELGVYANELATALLYMRLPGWADDEAPSPDARPTAQRLQCATPVTCCLRPTCA